MSQETERVVEAPLTDEPRGEKSAAEEELRSLAGAVRARVTTARARRTPLPPPPAIPDGAQTLELLREELDYWKEKAIQLDTTVFEMRALLQSGKGFSEVLHVETLLHAFMAVCRERYGAVNSAVMLLDDLDPENVYYRVRAYFGLEDFLEKDGIRDEMLMFKIPQDHGLLWQLINQGDVFSVRDMQRLPRFKTAFKRWRLEVLRSDVWVPLVRGSQVLGILTLGECEDGSQIPDHEYAFLQEIAAVAATNIDSAIKYEKNARILTNLRTLYDVNQQLANVNDFKALTIESLSTAVDALKAQKANLMLYNPETERLEIKVVWGNIPKATLDAINEGRMATKSFAIGEGVAGKAAKLKKAVRLNDRSRIEQVGRNIAYCILSVPLLYGGEVVGVMTITNRVKNVEGKLELDPLGRFGEEDEQLLLGLADQAAVNLHKARLYSASITDRLTGLYNARHFEATLESSIEQSRQTRKEMALAVVDIDHFKRFNDTYGHKAGDAVLAHAAQLFAEQARSHPRASAFRYGGEEFCMLLTETDAKGAAATLEEYRQRIEGSEIDYDGQRLRVTVSAGLATFPVDADSRKELFEAADRALYASKGGGRNCVTITENGGVRRITPERN
ncbi:MAG: sensor domain-containing diguanylate cyclase [Deltaproteobacteria bacterium]|nr:sensor domain-containing diguanylate cyclase [Deltaproteobacteria bacterium]